MTVQETMINYEETIASDEQEEEEEENEDSNNDEAWKEMCDEIQEKDGEITIIDIRIWLTST